MNAAPHRFSPSHNDVDFCASCGAGQAVHRAFEVASPDRQCPRCGVMTAARACRWCGGCEVCCRGHEDELRGER